MRKAVISLFVVILLSPISVFAGFISGKLVDNKTKEAIGYANVTLVKSGSNTPLRAITTTPNGLFNFQNLAFGKYNLKISFVGYTPIELPIALNEKRAEINLGSIFLENSSKDLNEVKVTGQKSQMRFEIDRKVFNVDQQLAAAGASASEVLKNIPSVEVDVQGNVSLRNNSNVIIWINGRPSGLNEDNRAQVLEQMPAETIDRIEVITNPSAKFSPDGSAGIINIVLKKDRKTGYYGSISGGADTFNGVNSAFNINYNSKKWDLFANAGYRSNKIKSITDNERTSWNVDTTNLVTKADGQNTMGGFFSRFGGSYHATEKDLIGFTIMANRFERSSDNEINYSQSSNLSPNISKSARNTQNDGHFKMNSLSLDYTHEFEKKGHELKTSVEVNTMNIDNANKTITTQGSGYAQNMDVSGTRKELEITADYTYPMSETSKFEAGFKGEYDDRNSTTDAQRGANYSSLSPLVELNNIFKSNENRSSVYLTYSGKIKALSYQGGLRGEYNTMTNTSYNYDKSGNTITTPFDKTYPGLYPSLFIDYSLPKGNELQLNYTRRVNRPHGRQMNPYRDMSDPNNVNFGNPQLRPEYSNSLELNYIKTWTEHTLSTSLYYRTTSDVMQQVNFVDKNVKYATTKNITDSKASGLEVIMKDRFLRFIDLTSTVNVYYSKLNAFSYGGDSASFFNVTSADPSKLTFYPGVESFSWTARSMANIVLPGMWMMQLTGNYQSARDIAQGRVLPDWGVDAGIRKMFFNRKVILNLMARDIFNSHKNRVESNGINFNDYTRTKMGGRMFGFILTYNFGNGAAQKKKPDTKRNNQNGDTDMMNGGEF